MKLGYPNIPIIPFGLFKTDPMAFALAFGGELRENLFVGISEHGIPDDLIREKRIMDNHLFSLERTTLEKYKAGDIDQGGFFGEGKEYAKSGRPGDKKLMWQTYREIDPEDERFASYPKNVWPEEMPPIFQRLTTSLFHHYDSIFDCLMLSLELYMQATTAGIAKAAQQGRNTCLRTNFYPKVLPGELTSLEGRNHAHTDVCALTLLYKPREEGLEFRDKNGNWVKPFAPDGTIYVNAGKTLCALTNGFFKPAWHRVIAPENPDERMSLPFFGNFQPDFMIQALPQFVGPNFPNPLPPMSAVEFRNSLKTNDIVRNWINEVTK